MTEFSYQLYSSREFPPLADTLRMLKELGYNQVEGYGGLYDDPSALGDGLKAAGLTMSSGHFSLDMLEEEPAKVLATAAATGMKAIYCPHLAAELRPTDAAGWRTFGERLEKAGAPYRDAGLIFGWHNHDFEFQALADGTIPMDEILAGGPNLSWEMDIAWVERGCADPLDWINRHKGRINAVHIKDIAPQGECADEDGWADVGFGTMDWNNIWAALQDAPVSLFVMEHDKPNDHVRFARRSLASVKTF